MSGGGGGGAGVVYMQDEFGVVEGAAGGGEGLGRKDRG
jgi:hypothetical protein